MDKRLLTVPQLMFIIGTRAALAAGVGMLASRRLSDRLSDSWRAAKA